MSLQNTALENPDEEFVDELKPGTELMHGQYTIEAFLAAGGFGITYLARDSLNRRVVIKECFPGSFCRRQNCSVTPRSRAHQNELKSIVRLFSQEAMSLAKSNHPNIVGVHQVFEENNTAYMALDYIQGRDLLEILQDDPDSLQPELVEGYLKKTLDAIGHIHQMGILHRDISPDNIIINEQGEPILIDFGAARESTNERVTRMLSALRVVKDGYSPQEFYIAGSDQSPSCDLYSLAASFYHLITKELPPDSQWRLSSRAAGDNDPYVPLGQKTDAHSKIFTSSLDKAMAILPRERMQSAEEWLAYLNGTDPVATRPSPKAAEPAAAKSEKKSMVPMLLGTTALVVAAGAGYFFVSNPGSEVDAAAPAPTEIAAAPETPVVEAPIAPVETTSTLPTEVSNAPVEPELTAPIAEEQPVLPVETPAELAAPAATPSPAARPVIEDQPDVPVVADVAPEAAPEEFFAPIIADVTFEVARPSVDQVEETIISPIALALPDKIAAPQPRPQREQLAALVAPDDALPVVDALPPAAPVPLPPVQTTEEVAAGEAEEEFSPLAFFNSLAPSEDIVATVATPAAPTEPVTTQTVTSEVNSSSVITRYVLAVPFILSNSEPGVIVAVAADSPAWLAPNSKIVSINGQPVSSNEQINSMLEGFATQEGTERVDVTLGVDARLSGVAFERTISVANEKHTLLLNGLSFVTRKNNGAWVTKVTATPAGSNFTVGDTLVSYISTWETIDGPHSLDSILERELANGTSSFSFAVNRNNEIWVEAFNLALLEN